MFFFVLRVDVRSIKKYKSKRKDLSKYDKGQIVILAVALGGRAGHLDKILTACLFLIYP